LQASRLKVTQIILKSFDNITRNMSLRKKSNRQIQNLNLPGEWLIGVGWVMNSVVIITTDV